MQLRRTRQKTNSLCVGESLREGNRSHPPCVATELGDSPRGKSPDWVAKMPKWVARMRRASAGGGERDSLLFK